MFIMLVVSFILLFIAFAMFKSNRHAKVAYWGFGINVFVTVIFVLIIWSANASVRTLSEGAVSSVINLNLFPFLSVLLSVGTAVLFVKRPEEDTRLERNGLYTFFCSLFYSLFTLMCIFPIYYLFINTISDNRLVQSGQINLYPKGIHFENYLALLNVGDLYNAAMISVYRTVLGTIVMVLASALVGYLVTQQKMFARRFIYRFIVITMYFNAGLIPWYLNIMMLGLTNNFWGYIIPAVIAPFNIILVKTYIESLPKELEESAFIDGAGYFTVFRSIILPLCKPILATIAVFGAVGHWNSFVDSIILMGGEPRLYTLQHRLYMYLNMATNLGNLMDNSGAMREQDLAAALNSRINSLTVSMVSIIPILMVYPFMQRFFQKGLMLGAVKG